VAHEDLLARQQRVRDHRGALLPQDDVTFVVIKVAAPTATMV